MNTSDIAKLIAGAVRTGPQTWAELGSGTGAFTLALRGLAGPDVKIFSIDRNAASLRQQQMEFDSQFPETDITFVAQDFTEPLDLPPLDGLLAANSLHFVRDQHQLLARLRDHLRPTGRMVIVEYDMDTGSPFVPYPLPFRSLSNIARQAGFTAPRLLARAPSRFGREIYSAVIKKL